MSLIDDDELRLIGKPVGRVPFLGHEMSALMYAFSNAHTSRVNRSGRAAKRYTAESPTAVPRAIIGTIQAWRHSDGCTAMPKRVSIDWFDAAA